MVISAEAALLALFEADLPHVRKAEKLRNANFLESERTCKRCGKIFVATSHLQFCSDECRKPPPKPPTVLNCKRCRTPFERTSTRQFLCPNCKGKNWWDRKDLPKSP